MKKLVMFILLFISMVGCAGGHQYVVQNDNGTFYRVNDVGHTNLARKGAQYSLFELCSGPEEAPNCEKVAEETAVNNTLFEQLAGPGATVGAAELLRRGIRDSGDTVNVKNDSSSESTGVGFGIGQGGDGGDSYSCTGNCAKKGFAPPN